MLRPQDIMLLLKLIANTECARWSQAKMARNLYMNVSELNLSMHRLLLAKLVTMRMDPLNEKRKLYQPLLDACEDLIFSGIAYMFPLKLGSPTNGIKTSYGSPLLEGAIASDEPAPVWPYIKGEDRGRSFPPIHPSVPVSITQFPDDRFYNMLCLIDVLRQGNRRECVHAKELLLEMIKDRRKDIYD